MRPLQRAIHVLLVEGTQFYPYYLCPNRGCESYGKSVKREVMKGHFEDLLKTLRPSENLYAAAQAMFGDLWDHRLANSEVAARSLKTRLLKIDQQIDQFLDRIPDTAMPSVAAAYEDRIRKLGEQKIVLIEKTGTAGRPARSFGETLRTALDFLASPWLI